MGIRVHFSYGAENGALDHFLSAPLNDFRAWLQFQVDNDDEVMVVEPPINLLNLTDDIIERGAIAFVPKTADQARMLDILVDEFYFWCDLYRPELLVDADVGTLRIQYYNAVEPDIHNQFGKEAGHLWQYILSGRPVGRPENPFPYTPAEADYPNSFWTYDEVGFLYYRMLPYQEDSHSLFGTEGSTVVTAFEAIKNAFSKEVGLIIEVA